jgi:8-oxo-dGTP pyrophosphatase MutT (NUDIX family)
VVEHNDKYLMVLEQRDGRWVYNQPAGHIECGESIINAAIRETLEETNYLIKPQAVAGICVYHAQNGISYIRTTIVASIIDHYPDRQLDPDIHSAHWMSYAEIQAKQQQLRSPIVLKVINDVRQGNAYPLDMLSEHR